MDGSTLTPDSRPADDFVIDQGWERYTPQDHAIWRRLFERQSALLPDRACRAYLDGLAATGAAADGIPHFGRASDALAKDILAYQVEIGRPPF